MKNSHKPAFQMNEENSTKNSVISQVLLFFIQVHRNTQIQKLPCLSSFLEVKINQNMGYNHGKAFFKFAIKQNQH